MQAESTPRAAAPAEPVAGDLLQYPRTEMGDAERILSLFGHQLRYATGLGFYVWDGKRFERDPERHTVTHLALLTMRELYGVAGNLEDTEQREKWAKWSIAGEKRSRLTNAVELLPIDGRILHDAEDFDAAPHLLNLESGTLNLDKATERPHNTRDNITRIAPGPFDPNATAPRFERFISEIFAHDQELITYIQKALGYSISGHTDEECLFVAYGVGANGKSTLLRTIGHVLGEYAATTQFETLATKRNEAIRNDVAALHGPRFVSASEGNSNQQLAEGLAKQLTGRDPVTARFLYSEPFTFTPKFKIWLATNHKPRIRGVDEGIWRRIRLIPFNVTIPPEQRDPHLDQALADETPGILNWLLAGYLMWKQDGLGTSTAVTEATNQYRRDSDSLHDFIGACCDTTDPTAATTSKAIYTEYARWCDTNGEDALNATTFGRLLTERGHPTQTQWIDGRTAKVRTGIKLQPVRR